MSLVSFVRYGEARRLIGRKDGGKHYGEIKLYDIGEDGLVGAKYDDGSCQAHPVTWYPPEVRRALRQGTGGRPLLQETDGSASRPRLESESTVHRPRLEEDE